MPYFGYPLQEQLVSPPFLSILRTDNLPAAIKACETGGWIVKVEKQPINIYMI
jgi:hypothetical protein